MQFDLAKRRLYILATSLPIMSGFGGSQWEKVAMLKLPVGFLFLLEGQIILHLDEISLFTFLVYQWKCQDPILEWMNVWHLKS